MANEYCTDDEAVDLSATKHHGISEDCWGRQTTIDSPVVHPISLNCLGSREHMRPSLGSSFARLFDKPQCNIRLLGCP